MYFPPEKSQSGQALLIVLLVMAVVLTTVLSVASRSVVDIATTSYEEDALRAFSAAEAGVEQALLKQGPVSSVLDPTANVGFNANLTNPVPGNVYVYPDPLSNGETATFWFVEHNASDNSLTCSGGNCTRTAQLNICWGNNPGINSLTPAVEISIYYDPLQQAFGIPNSFGGLKVIRLTSDRNTARTPPNSFDSAQSGCPFGGYAFESGNIQLVSEITSCSVNTDNCLVMAKVRMFYNATPQPIALRTTGGTHAELPPQGFQVDSKGTAGESVRNLNVLRTYPEPQGVFESAVFSRNSLTKP